MDKNGKFTILSIDDDASFRGLLKIKLEAAGFIFIEAVNGKEGLKKVKELTPDLILMDVQMPEMNGVEALSAIKSDPGIANSRVLFLTNYGEADNNGALLDDKFAKEIGALGHLKKTDDLDKIIERIRSELAKV